MIDIKKYPKENPEYDLPAPEQPQMPSYQQPMTALFNAIDYLLNSPSIPLTMRRQFFMLWENVIFGNYNQIDIKYLMSKFREWCILLKWYIPEQRWGNVMVYQDVNDVDSKMEMDLNILLNTLTHLYFINLTRGKEGFTVKEMTTMRSIMKTGEEETKKRRSLRLF